MGALFLGVKSGFNNVRRVHLGTDAWRHPSWNRTSSGASAALCMSDRQVKLVLDEEVCKRIRWIPEPQGPGGSDPLHHLPVGHLRRGGRVCPGVKKYPLWTTSPGGQRERIKEVANKLTELTTNNVVAFDHEKTEASTTREPLRPIRLRWATGTFPSTRERHADVEPG